MNEEKDRDTGGLRPQYWTYERQKCFIAYTEQANWSDDLLSACKEVLSRPEFNLEPDYARKHFDPDIPLRQKALELIANARYGIYDLSYWQDEKCKWHMPRNVYIELGLAIALNRPTLLLRHASNQELDLPECLQSISGHILEFSGETTLKQPLGEQLRRWVNAPSERDWWNPYCIFGGRTCEYRKVHPRARGWGQKKLRCHISDGPDINRPDFRSTVEDVLERFSDVTLDYLDALPMSKGYDFLLCTHCQTVRSTPFAIYRITPHTLAEAFVAIGMSIALEMQFEYNIPKVLLADNLKDVPSLLSGYEVVVARSDKERKAHLRTFMPAVLQKVREAYWRPRPLPFIEVTIQPDPALPKEETLPQGTTEAGESSKATVLFADNDPRFLASQKEYLERAGYEVVIATNPVEAKSVLERREVDLAILDLRMTDDADVTDRSGLELAQEETFRDIPKIIISGYPVYDAVREALESAIELPPAWDFITKQEGPDALLQAISRALKIVVGPDQKLREAEVSSPAELGRKTVEFLSSLPNIHSEAGRQALIVSAALDQGLVSQLNYVGPTTQFWQLLIDALLAYGTLNDGRDALQAVLEAAKDYVGQDRKEHCNALIQEWLAHRQLSQIPIVSDIAAGLGVIAEDDVEEYLLLDGDRYHGADFGVRVVGDSMKDDGILPGDIALIVQQPVVESGEIAAIVIVIAERTVGVLKRYYAYGEREDLQHWLLKSSNPASEYLVLIPGGANVKAVQALYEKAIRSGRIRNPIRFYEDVEVVIAGKCVGLVRNKVERLDVQAVSQEDAFDVFDFARAEVQILIADNDPDIRSLVRLIVSREGYSSVREAGTGREALAVLESEPYDLMILDSRTPDTDWRELVHRAYELQPELPIILIVHRAVDTEIAALKVETVVDYLTKPFTAEDLADSVNRALQRQAKR